jgi:predicted Zn-dependent peptidase
MKYRTQILPNVFLTSVQTDKFKTGCFSLNLLRPLCRGEASANALIPSVLLRGSKQYPDIRSISARLDELYGASMGTLIRKKGEVQFVGFFADYLEDELAHEPVFSQMADFVAEILFHPVLEDGVFGKDATEGEKWNLANTIESRINDKRSYSISQLLKTMCRDEIYGIPRLGDLEDLETISETSLYRSYRRILETSQIEIFYMGRTSPETAAEKFREVLRELPRGDIVPVGTNFIPAAADVREVTESLDVTQGKLSLGFRTGCTVRDPEYPALVVMSTIYGGGITSKLFQKVREEQSLCYYASSSVEKFKGVMVVSSGIEFSDYEKAKTEILRQLDECRQGHITQEEFDSAKRYLLSDLKTGLDSPGRLDDFYMGQIMEGLDGTMEELAARIEAVTMDETVAAAKRVSLDTVYFLRGTEA